MATAIVLHNLDGAGELGNRGLTLRGTGLEKLGNTGKTLSDIGSRSHTTGVEGTQRQLGTRLTDGLGGDDTNGLANVDQLVGGQRPAIALGAHTALGLAGQHGTALDFLYAMGHEIVEHVHGQGIVTLVQHGLAVSRVNDIGSEQTGVRTTIGGLNEHQVAIGVTVGHANRQTGLGATVLFAHDDVLGDVDQTTGQITRLCGTQCGISQTLTCTVLGDEVLQHGQAVTVVGLHRTRNNLTLRVSHEASHTSNLVDLHHVASCTRLHDDGQVGGRVELVLDFLGHLGGALGPQVNELLTAGFLGQQTHLVVGVDLVGLGLVLGDLLVALRRLVHVGEGEGHTGPRGAGEAEILEGIQRGGHLLGGVTHGDVIDDLGQAALGHLIVNERVVGRRWRTARCRRGSALPWRCRSRRRAGRAP